MKPVPEIASELTFTADVPEEVSVNVIVFAVFTVSLPKLRLDALSVNFGLGLRPCPYCSGATGGRAARRSRVAADRKPPGYGLLSRSA